jgi:hypothetical protein
MVNGTRPEAPHDARPAACRHGGAVPTAPVVQR